MSGTVSLLLPEHAKRNERYGWVPDRPDMRDLAFRPSRATLAKLPPKFSLRDKIPSVRDQGQLGSCTGNGIAAAIDLALVRQGRPPLDASRLFIYWNERSMEGTVDSDAGAMIRDGIRSVHRLGAPPESAWPYDIARFRERPPEPCYTDAATHQVERYERIARRSSAIKAAILDGYGVVLGFTVYASFESTAVERTGLMPMPSAGEEVKGAHCVCAIGWDDLGSPGPLWEQLNSWGDGWGDGGCFWMPQPYLLDANLSDDFWAIKLLEAA